jgi:anti-anti-sigma factor
MALDVVQKKVGEIPVIAITGRAVDIDVKKLAKALEGAYKKKYARIVLNVSNTDFVDSHALGTIVYYHTLMQKEGRELVILNANTNQASYLNRLFELTHLNKVLKIIDNEKLIAESIDRPAPKTAGFGGR